MRSTEPKKALHFLLARTSTTKKEVMSLAMSLYDPLGQAAFITIIPKVFMRKVCRYSLEWNSLIPEELIPAWKRTNAIVNTIMQF